ncbi:MAG: DoxX family membrane protein [Candidatus Rhabdochlamydia sp.]
MKKVSLFLGRVCLSLIFVISVVMKILHWDSMVSELSSVFQDWSYQISWAAPLFQACIPYVTLLLIIATLLEIIGALSLLCNSHIRVGSICLVIFLVPVTLLMHPFWFSNLPNDMMMFCKNIGIIGGLLTVAAYGDES